MGPPGGEVIYCSLTNILLHAVYCFPDRTPDDTVSPEVPIPSNTDQVDQPTSVADADALAIMESIYKPEFV